jgi:hypothetical protein
MRPAYLAPLCYSQWSTVRPSFDALTRPLVALAITTGSTSPQIPSAACGGYNSGRYFGVFFVQLGRKKILAVDLDSLQREAPVTISWSVFKDPPLDVIHVMTRNYAKS